MFDLEKEVTTWTVTVFGTGCRANESIEELEDHLYTEIEHLQTKGLSQAEAFYKAIERLGPIEVLQAEYAKNHSLIARLQAFEESHINNKIGKRLSERQRAIALIGFSLFIAALILLTSALMNDSENSFLIMMAVLIPLWFVGQAVLTAPDDSNLACEIKALRRVFKRTE